MQKLIAISPGHYPEKPGACFEGFCEHDEAVRWVDTLHDLLGPGNAVKVPGKTLRDKVAFIKARTPGISVAVEIHFNSFKQWIDKDHDEVIDDDELFHAGRGCETLYFPDSEQGMALAAVCQEALVQFFPPDRGIKEGWYRMQKRFGPDFFLERTPCPAVILEPDFIHRRDEITAHREEACKALAKALLDFVTEDG